MLAAAGTKETNSASVSVMDKPTEREIPTNFFDEKGKVWPEDTAIRYWKYRKDAPAKGSNTLDIPADGGKMVAEMQRMKQDLQRYATRAFWEESRAKAATLGLVRVADNQQLVTDTDLQDALAPLELSTENAIKVFRVVLEGKNDRAWIVGTVDRFLRKNNLELVVVKDKDEESGDMMEDNNKKKSKKRDLSKDRGSFGAIVREVKKAQVKRMQKKLSSKMGWKIAANNYSSRSHTGHQYQKTTWPACKDNKGMEVAFYVVKVPPPTAKRDTKQPDKEEVSGVLVVWSK